MERRGKQLKEIKLHWLFIGELITWLGASFVWPLTSVYLNKRLGISLSMIGVVLFCNCAANILASFIAGRLYDRFNPYPLLIFGAFADAVVLFLLAAFHGWPEYWVWLTLTGFLGGWNGTMINSIATSLRRYSGRYVFNMLYFAQNLGVVCGTLIVGYLYDYSVTLLFCIAGALYVIVGLNTIFHYTPIIAYHKARKACVRHGHALLKEPMPKNNLILSLGFFIALGLTWLMYMNWESNLSVYMVSLGIPFHLYSLLWTLNAGIIVVVQAVLAKFPEIFKTPFHQIIFGLSMFSLSYVTLLFAKDFGHFVLSMTVLTLGESTAFPAIPAYVNDMSPLSSKGKYQGLTNVASSFGRAFGPMFGGFVIESLGYLALFWIAAIVIALTIVCLIPLHKRLAGKLTLFK